MTTEQSGKEFLRHKNGHLFGKLKKTDFHLIKCFQKLPCPVLTLTLLQVHMLFFYRMSFYGL